MAEMAPFDWADPLNLDDQLTEEERMIREAARRACCSRASSRHSATS